MRACTWIGNKHTWGHPAPHNISARGLLMDGLQTPAFLVNAVTPPASFSGRQRVKWPRHKHKGCVHRKQTIFWASRHFLSLTWCWARDRRRWGWEEQRSFVKLNN